MPKISTNNIKIYDKDIHKEFTVVVNYNQSLNFYAKFPKELEEVVHHLESDTKDSLFIEKHYKSKNDRFRDIKGEYVISSQTESECLTRMNLALKTILPMTVEQKDVIILFYKGEGRTQYNTHLYNKEHPQIKLEIGLTYAVETTAGEKKVYSIYGENERNGRRELTLWNEAATIVDDTPKNREMLEHLYSSMKHLNNKLKEFTETPETLLALIESNVKLLGK